MTEPAAPARRPRSELVRQRSLRTGWILVGVGLLIPFLALGGAYIGWSWRRAEGGGHLALIATGIGVFVVRFTLWRMGIP
jgi:hypothetical protein